MAVADAEIESCDSVLKKSPELTHINPCARRAVLSIRLTVEKSNNAMASHVTTAPPFSCEWAYPNPHFWLPPSAGRRSGARRGQILRCLREYRAFCALRELSRHRHRNMQRQLPALPDIDSCKQQPPALQYMTRWDSPLRNLRSSLSAAGALRQHLAESGNGGLPSNWVTAARGRPAAAKTARRRAADGAQALTGSPT